MDGILIVSYGTAYRESRRNTIDSLLEAFQNAFLHIPVYLAFTSRTILKKIQKEEGIYIDTIKEALKRMEEERITRVFVQATYLFREMQAGEEEACIFNAYRKKFSGGIVSVPPLLKYPENLQKVYSVLFQKISEFKKNVSRETFKTALVFISHNDYCHNLQDMSCAGFQNIYIGSITGEKSAESVLKLIQEKEEIKHVIFVPFFFLAGKHVFEDIAGDKKSSWKSVFCQAGFEVACIKKGLGEYPEIQKCYIENLKRFL